MEISGGSINVFVFVRLGFLRSFAVNMIECSDLQPWFNVVVFVFVDFDFCPTT